MKQTTAPKPELLDVGGGNKLHIGGTEAKEGWKLLNIQGGDNVDYVGDMRDLSQFSDAHFDVVYASHVLEHVGYQKDLPAVLTDIHRILKPKGRFFVSVPDLDTLCRLFVHEQVNKESRFYIMRVMFGGQMDEHDFHHVGLTDEFLADFLLKTGFKEIYRVPEFNIFDDSSSLKLGGVLISLNMIAIK